MLAQLKDWRLFLRFFCVNGAGTVVDYIVAVLLATTVGVNDLVSTSAGFIVGAGFNYVGHTLFSYEHTNRSHLSFRGYLKYLLAVMLSLLVRLATVATLNWLTPFPFWIVLFFAIGTSFLASYVVATLWVFRKPQE